MGWTSTADPLAHVGRSALEFDRRACVRSLLCRTMLMPRPRSAESAKDFASRHGWEFELREPAVQSLGSTCTRGAGKVRSTCRAFCCAHSSTCTVAWRAREAVQRQLQRVAERHSSVEGWPVCGPIELDESARLGGTTRCLLQRARRTCEQAWPGAAKLVEPTHTFAGAPGPRALVSSACRHI
jgi:hypothetical protein